MRLFFIYAYVVAVYADWYAHIHMKPHRQIRIVYANMRISAYAEKTHICRKTTNMLIWQVNSSVPPDWINDFENIHRTICKCSLDRFTKTFFWNFQKSRADLCYILIYKQLLEMVFCSIIAPSLSSGNHLFYRAEYISQSCPNHVWAITLTGVH